ncbi:MAG: hypothetical protein PWQ57_850 [Desulfovibrionales bacterium]|nr:hypothetical protein [Desulfovibrionales bacterium]
MPAEKRDRDKELRDIEAALKRASQRAEESARQTGAALIPWEDGKVVKDYPGDQVSAGNQQSE